ncbi:MAG: hypothetical protein A3K19_10720 [Lentisphaerae bacterium RIFOXYB12_FULL_65_16]|nr:MAG: hypothetical protein A3K18_29870 [Lentisphaerae bacterium RIFOXYA12_64_32]OGV87924.1 MAG: hypothetical protein A3K19_10720 [Lentisphaerae bacterium RIFOXYB12_FULL_65_16]
MKTQTSNEDPWAVLGIALDASDADIRAAYLAGVKRHPPDRDPDAFERIRDAYERIREPSRRISLMLLQVDPMAPFVSLLDAAGPAPRRLVGMPAWLDALKEA